MVNRTNRAGSALAVCGLVVAVPVARAEEAPAVSTSVEAAYAAKVAGPLEVRTSFGAMYGVVLERDGRDVGPGFLAHRLDDAVRGVPTAERHARRAQTWAKLNGALVLLGAGLLAADLLTYADRSGRGSLAGWPNFVPDAEQRRWSDWTSLGWFASMSAAAVTRYMTYEEMMASVNAYNLAKLQVSTSGDRVMVGTAWRW